MANLRNVRAMFGAAWRWTVLFAKCTTLVALWLGVVATMLGMLCELVLLPLRLPPNQTALIYLYQDWTMGVLALKLWHLIVMVAPRREGVALAEDSWQAHFDALQHDGIRNLNFHRALTKIVLPVLVHLATSLAVPYIISRGILPLFGLPAIALQYANLYSYQVCHVIYLAYLGSRRLRKLLVDLHNAIRDDRYLVGRELNNFTNQQKEAQQAAAAAARLAQAEQQAGGVQLASASDAAEEVATGTTGSSNLESAAEEQQQGSSSQLRQLSSSAVEPQSQLAQATS